MTSAAKDQGVQLGGAKSGQARSWFVYLLLCGDGSLYTGITTDPARRFWEHKSGRGARYTRSRGVKAVVWLQETADQSCALSLEAAIKRQSVVTKRTLANLA